MSCTVRTVYTRPGKMKFSTLPRNNIFRNKKKKTKFKAGIGVCTIA